jgi:hypothetical protein
MLVEEFADDDGRLCFVTAQALLERLSSHEALVQRPCSPPAAVFDLRAHFCHSAPMETYAFRFRPRANAPEG